MITKERIKEIIKRWWFLEPLFSVFFIVVLWKCLKTVSKMLRRKKINWREA